MHCEESEYRLELAPDKRPDLHKAAEIGDLDQLKRLIDAGAEVNDESFSYEAPLHWASTGEVVTLLVDHGADLSSTGKAGQGPLSSACFRMWPTAVKRFLELGCNVNERDFFFGNTPLMSCVMSLANQTDPARTDSERVAIIRLLKGAGADINALSNNGDTAMKIANRYNAEAIIKALGG